MDTMPAGLFFVSVARATTCFQGLDTAGQLSAPVFVRFMSREIESVRGKKS